MKPHWIYPALIILLATASCEKRSIPDHVDVTATVIEMQPYVKVIDSMNYNGFYILPGEMTLEVSATYDGTGKVEGGGVQLTNIAGADASTWDQREVIIGIVQTSDEVFSVTLSTIDPWWDVFGDVWSTECDSIGYYRPMVIVDGELFFGDDVQIKLGPTGVCDGK
jgi:hypothetical protein